MEPKDFSERTEGKQELQEKREKGLRKIGNGDSKYRKGTHLMEEDSLTRHLGVKRIECGNTRDSGNVP